MAKILYIIAKTNFRDEELLEPKSILEKAGHEVVIASSEQGRCKGMMGASIEAEYAVRDVDPDDYDAVVVCGGSGSPSLLNYPEVLKIIKHNADYDKLVAAICLGGMILAKAGALKGKKATVYRTTESVKMLKEGGASITDNAVEIDGNIITANGPQAAKMFGMKIKEMLS